MAVALILYLLSGCLALSATLTLSRVNPRDRIPAWGQPPNRPWAYKASWAMAMICAFVATRWSDDRIGTALAFLLFGVALIVPFAAVSTLHNRRLIRTPQVVQDAPGADR